MKNKLFLLPITLTALTPTIGMVGCGNHDDPTPTPPEPEADITVDLSNDMSHNDKAETQSNEFEIDTSKVYCFTVHADICNPPETPWEETSYFTFAVGTHPDMWHYVDIDVLQVVVRDKVFSEGIAWEALSPGKYARDTMSHTIYGNDYQNIDSYFSMRITLKFPDHDGEQVIARWLGRT